MAEEQFQIEQAVRSKALARIALVSPSGGGKTTSALLMAKGIVEYMLELGVLAGTLKGKVGVIDTERRSASLYAHLYDYDVINLAPPYSMERYLGALHALERAGCAVVIIDQASHAWAGMGGLLETVDALKGSGASENKGFSAWKDVSPEYTVFIETLLASPAHLIVNMRAKTAYTMEEYHDRHGNKKVKPVKVGLKPIFREGFEYEFTTVFDLQVEGNVASSTKDRTGLFQGKTCRLDAEWGKRLAHWLLSGQEADAARDTTTPLQKAQAVVGAGQRACERAKNRPDLEREFTLYRDQLRGMKDQLPEEEYQLLFLDLRSAAAERGQALTTAPTSPPPADAISFDEAVALEEWLVAGSVAREAFLQNFELPRFGHLSTGRLQAAVDWVDARLRATGDPTPALPKLLAAKAKVGREPNSFDDLEDDLPFK